MREARIPPYSSRARVALAIARALAAGRGDPDVTAIHVALGLLREGENAAVAALHHAGVALHAIRGELEAALGPPPGRTRPEEVDLPLTPAERHVAEQARAAARLEGDEYVGPEHLLLGILRDERSAAARLFARHGCNGETARTHLGAVAHKHRSPPSPAASPPAV